MVVHGLVYITPVHTADIAICRRQMSPTKNFVDDLSIKTRREGIYVL